MQELSCNLPMTLVLQLSIVIMGPTCNKARAMRVEIEIQDWCQGHSSFTHSTFILHLANSHEIVLAHNLFTHSSL